MTSTTQKKDTKKITLNNLIKSIQTIDELNHLLTNDTYYETLKNVTCLTIPVCNDETLKKISNICPNLTELTLHKTNITNIDPLKNLTNIKLLNLDETKINNLNPIKIYLN